MEKVDKYFIEQLSKLVPDANAIEGRASIGDKSYSVEFFAVINGQKYQCYDLMDDGIIDEDEFDVIVEQIAEYVRTTPDYHTGEINDYFFK